MERINALGGLSVKKKGSKVEIQASFNDDPKVAVTQIRALEVQLRAMKGQAVAEEKVVRAQYQSAAEGTTYKPGVGGALLGAKYRSSMRKQAASARKRLTMQKNAATIPYEEVKVLIDQILASLAVKKAELAGRK